MCKHEAARGAYLGLAGALHDGAGLDNAVKLEAAVLVDGRHDAGVVCAQGLEARVGGRLELHRRRADGDGLGGRVEIGCGHCGGHVRMRCIPGRSVVSVWDSVLWARRAAGFGQLRANVWGVFRYSGRVLYNRRLRERQGPCMRESSLAIGRSHGQQPGQSQASQDNGNM